MCFNNLICAAFQQTQFTELKSRAKPNIPFPFLHNFKLVDSAEAWFLWYKWCRHVINKHLLPIDWFVLSDSGTAVIHLIKPHSTQKKLNNCFEGRLFWTSSDKHFRTKTVCLQISYTADSVRKYPKIGLSKPFCQYKPLPHSAWFHSQRSWDCPTLSPCCRHSIPLYVHLVPCHVKGRQKMSSDVSSNPTCWQHEYYLQPLSGKAIKPFKLFSVICLISQYNAVGICKSQRLKSYSLNSLLRAISQPIPASTRIPELITCPQAPLFQSIIYNIIIII